MSKDNANLRLLGSPVHLSYRSKKKDDRKNIRNRPRSALQNSCFTPDNQERYKRPFSADAKERAPSTKSFYKTFSSDLLQYNNYSTTENPYPHPYLKPHLLKTPTIHTDYPVTTIKILPPTADLLGNSKSDTNCAARDKDICSNASDYGSEDTFISLGTKIKAKAQVGIKAKNSPSGKNATRYRNIAKRGRKYMENRAEEKNDNEYGVEVKIKDKNQRSSSPKPIQDFRERSPSPVSFSNRPFDSYFIPFEGSSKKLDDDLSGRVSFGTSSNIQAEVEQAIDTYSRRLTLTKQQLSLVEEESVHDVETTSQRMSSLSPEISLEEPKKDECAEENLTGRNTYVLDKTEEYPKTQNFMNGTKSYTNFYDNVRNSSIDNFKTITSSHMTDVESKDSGYHDSGANEEKAYKQNFSLPGTSLKKSSSYNKIETQPKSLDSISSSDKEYHKTFPLDKKSQWAEPLNHSRLLYKDFFLKKEGHIALPPQNSPKENNSTPAFNGVDVENKPEHENSDYPSYLLNSTTKAYTSKVIEDYKKELEAINSLHELTIKDIKTDAVSPTPLNIDKMFEQHASLSEENHENNKTVEDSNVSHTDKNSLDVIKNDISKVSTKELIQNYFRVKGGDPNKDYLAKHLKKFENKKMSNVAPKVDTNLPSAKQDWNNKAKANTAVAPKSINIRNQTQKNLFTVHQPLSGKSESMPMSARLESVQNDKDIDSWMSLSAPSPSNDMEPLQTPMETRIEEPYLPEAMIHTTRSNTNREEILDRMNSPDRGDPHISPKAQLKESKASVSGSTSAQETCISKDLHPKSTVLDIYSMLKEIESFGDNPVASVVRAEMPATPKVESSDERSATPKDHFMEIFEFLEKVERSATDALNVVTTTAPQTIPKLESLLKLPHTELAQRLVTASLQLEERSCCIALLQESLTNHKEQMINKITNLEKQSTRNISKVKQECEETIKRHQSFIDQLINDKKTLNHRIEQLVDERRSLEDRWKRSAQALEERYKLELKNQHDKMAAAQQVARQRWVRQKAEKIKELTVKGLEGELREMAERQQKEISELKMFHAEQMGRLQARHAADLEELRRNLESEREAALQKERHLAASRMEKQILELEVSYSEQRSRLIAELRAENERVAATLADREAAQMLNLEKWKEEQEKQLTEKRIQLEQEMAKEREKIEELLKQRQQELEQKFEQAKKDFEAEQQILLKKKVTEIQAQHKQERDREIEKAIESMEAEAQAGRRELQDALRRNKEQYEAELKELAETEQATLRRYQDAQARIRHTEDRCAELEVTINQLETRNKILTEKNIQLEKQAEEVRTQCERVWHAKVDSLYKEMDDLRKTHDEQMHQLYAKVKVAVARKDSAIQALTRETTKYQEKITLLEQKLQQQRKDFLKSK